MTALAFQAREIEAQLGALPHSTYARDAHNAPLEVRALIAALESGPPAIRESGSPELLVWLDSLGTLMGTFSDDLTNRYFSHTVPRIS